MASNLLAMASNSGSGFARHLGTDLPAFPVFQCAGDGGAISGALVDTGYPCDV